MFDLFACSGFIAALFSIFVVGVNAHVGLRIIRSTGNPADLRRMQNTGNLALSVQAVTMFIQIVTPHFLKFHLAVDIVAVIAQCAILLVIVRRAVNIGSPADSPADSRNPFAPPNE